MNYLKLTKKITIVVTLLTIVTSNALPFALAQNKLNEQPLSQTSQTIQTQQTQEITPPLIANIQVDKTVEVGKNILFDGSKTFNSLEQGTTIYHWDFGDGTEKDGLQAVHTYKKTGTYKVKLKVTNGPNISEAQADIYVYRKFILLITDQSSKKTQIEGLVKFAENEGVYLKVLDAFDSVSEFISEEALSKKISENTDSFNNSQEIIIWTEGQAGINAFNRVVNDAQKLKILGINDKIILVVSEKIENVQVTIKLKPLTPKQIFVAKEASIYPFIQSEPHNLVSVLQKGGYEYHLIDKSSSELHFWNFVSYFVNLLIESGIPDNTIFLILMLPVIASVVMLMRQVIGLTTYGMYSSSIVTLTFVVLGLKFGLMTLILSMLVGIITRYILKHVHLLYFSKQAIVLTVISFSLFIFLSLGIALKFFDSQFFSLAIFPMLILGTLTEKFTTLHSERSFFSTLKMSLLTVLVSVFAYFIIGGTVDLGIVTLKWSFLQNLLRSFPEIIFLFLLIDIAFGRWTGLRLVEYIRFREVLRHNEEE